MQSDLFVNESTAATAFILNDLANFLVVLNRFFEHFLQTFFLILVQPPGFIMPFLVQNIGRALLIFLGLRLNFV